MDIGLDSKIPDKCYRLTKSHDGGRCLMINIPELKAKSCGIVSLVLMEEERLKVEENI